MPKEPDTSDRPDDRVEPLDSTFELIERARQGDQQAIERLFARHLKPLQRWTAGRLPKWARDLADTDDLVQETLLQTFKRIGNFEPRRVGALQAYLRQAVLNRLRDEIRRKGRRPPSVELDEASLGAEGSPLEEAIGREAVESYERALGRLKPEEREAIVARVEMGYSYEELAQVLGKPTPDAARKAAQRALVRLAEEMKRRTVTVSSPRSPERSSMGRRSTGTFSKRAPRPTTGRSSISSSSCPRSRISIARCRSTSIPRTG